MCDVALKMSTKITASKEQVFRLHDCSEDDTLIIERTGVSFGALVLSRSCWRRSGFILKKCLYNVKDLAFLRGLSINTARQMTGSIVLYTAG